MDIDIFKAANECHSTVSEIHGIFEKYYITRNSIFFTIAEINNNKHLMQQYDEIQNCFTDLRDDHDDNMLNLIDLIHDVNGRKEINFQNINQMLNVTKWKIELLIRKLIIFSMSIMTPSIAG